MSKAFCVGSDLCRVNVQVLSVDVMTNEADALTTKIAFNRPCANVMFVQDLDDEGKVVCVVLLVREDNEVIHEREYNVAEDCFFRALGQAHRKAREKCYQ